MDGAVRRIPEQERSLLAATTIAPPPAVTVPRPARQAHWLLHAVPVALLTAVIGLAGADRQLWIDEYVTAYVTTLSWTEFTRLLGNQDLVHAAYYLFIRFWTDLFGSSALVLRLPSVAAMAVAAGALTLLGRRLHGPATGLLGGLLFAVVPAVSRYAQEARSYALVSALVVVSTVVLTYALESPGWWRWAGYAVPTLAAVYLHVASVLILLPHAVLVVQALATGGRLRTGRWFAAAGAVVVLVDPLLYFASRQADQVSWVRDDWPAVQTYPGDLFGSSMVASALIALGLLGGIMLRGARHRAAVPLLAWALAPPLFAYLTFDSTHLFLARYALFVVPAWCLLAAVAALGAAAGRRERLAAAVAVLVVAGFGGWNAQLDVRRSPLNGEPDFRAAARMVDEDFRPGDGIAFAGTERSGRLPFAHELRRATPTDVFVATASQGNGTFAPRYCDDPAVCLRATKRLWLVASNPGTDVLAGLPAGHADLLRDGFTVVWTREAPAVSVSLLVRRD